MASAGLYHAYPIAIACFKGERDGTLQLTFKVR
jgi:hypothetical protein